MFQSGLPELTRVLRLEFDLVLPFSDIFSSRPKNYMAGMVDTQCRRSYDQTETSSLDVSLAVLIGKSYDFTPIGLLDNLFGANPRRNAFGVRKERS